MPDWLWLIAMFLMLTIGYLTGFTCGNWKSQSETNPCPSENAYIREAEIMAEANVRIETRKAELDYQVKTEILKAEQQKGYRNVRADTDRKSD